MKDGKTQVARRLSLVALAGAPFVILAGCSISRLFPVANQHPANWVKDHAAAVLAAGGADKAKVDNGMTCNLCHTTKMVNGVVPRSPGADSTCFSCHQGGASGSPHRADWNSAHGTFVRDSNGYPYALISEATLSITDQACDACHTAVKSADGRVAKSPRAVTTCFSCHPSGPSGDPHPADYMVGHQHAVYAAGGADKVTITNATMGIASQSCSTCHSTTKDSHGFPTRSPKAATNCFSCHDLGSNFSPHPEGWMVPATGGGHATFVKTVGDFKKAFIPDSARTTPLGESCDFCHTAEKVNDLVPASPLAKYSCFTCHADAMGK